MGNYGVLQVEVISTSGIVWEGQAVNIIVRTVEGDLGVLPGRAPVLAVLVDCPVEIVTADGNRVYVAVDGGYISVEENRVAVLCQYGSLSEQISAEVALRERDRLAMIVDSGNFTEDELRRYHLASAQVKLANKLSKA